MKGYPVFWNSQRICNPKVQKLIDDEIYQQFSGLELIASENLTSLAVMEANGSILTNKYSEGLPRAQYYGGNKFINKLEILCQNQALEASRLDPQVWGVNVQPYSGSTTNIDPESKLIDYEYLKKTAKIYKPRILICGASAYPRDWDYKQLRKIADDQGAYLMMDVRFNFLVIFLCKKSIKSSLGISIYEDPQSHNLPLNNSIAGQPACSITTAPPNQQIQQPPINANGSKLFDIDPNSLPSNMKKEGEDWMMMSNPKVEKVVDVGLVHTLVHNSVVCCVKFLPNGNILATACNQNTMLCNTMTGSKICCMRYVKSNFLDGPRQDSYDLVTGSWNLKSNGNGDGRKEHEKQRFEGDGPKGRAKRVFDRDKFQMRLLRNNLIRQIHFQSETIDEGLDRFTGSPFGAVSLHAGSQKRVH
ncbi:pyridoxal phosphate-dependent transferase [Phakopsora pachyrhizi]|nr:pyridoxal phosphate-dependent transferase [Phakopsora pachyrhizi]